MSAGSEVGFAFAFLAGLVSFVSPCVLPLVPTYVAYLAGESFGAVRSGEAGLRERAAVMVNALAFVAGFSAVFIAFGLGASAVGQFLASNATAIRKVSGVVVVAMGLHLLGVLPLPWLDRERRLQAGGSGGGVINSWLIGVSFAAGWTPCIGPVLASILALASSARTMAAGAWLLAAYAAGLAVPFLVTAAALGRMRVWFTRLGPHLKRVEQASGALLVGIGIMLYTNTFLRLSGWFSWGF